MLILVVFGIRLIFSVCWVCFNYGWVRNTFSLPPLVRLIRRLSWCWVGLWEKCNIPGWGVRWPQFFSSPFFQLAQNKVAYQKSASWVVWKSLKSLRGWVVRRWGGIHLIMWSHQLHIGLKLGCDNKLAIVREFIKFMAVVVNTFLLTTTKILQQLKEIDCQTLKVLISSSHFNYDS